MNVPAYSVLTTTHFDRLMKKLAAKHPELAERFEQAVAILSTDPFNKSGKYAIKKLGGVSAVEGQYRLCSGRFRYDIEGIQVVLHYCGLRREDTY
jgi:hypothetical protein